MEGILIAHKGVIDLTFIKETLFFKSLRNVALNQMGLSGKRWENYADYSSVEEGCVVQHQ